MQIYSAQQAVFKHQTAKRTKLIGNQPFLNPEISGYIMKTGMPAECSMHRHQLLSKNTTDQKHKQYQHAN